MSFIPWECLGKDIDIHIVFSSGQYNLPVICSATYWLIFVVEAYPHHKLSSFLSQIIRKDIKSRILKDIKKLCIFMPTLLGDW